MTYSLRPRQSSRIVTMNAEESAEFEVVVLALNRAKYEIIRNDNQECMSDVFCADECNGQNVNAIDHVELSTQSLEAEIKKEGRKAN